MSFIKTAMILARPMWRRIY